LAGFTQGVLFAGLLAVEWTLLLLLHTLQNSVLKRTALGCSGRKNENKHRILRGKYEKYPLQGPNVL
jgi:hypothetical protein